MTMYEVWIADLNSLYDTEIRPAVFAEDCHSYIEAIAARRAYQSSDTAAWIIRVGKEGEK